MTSFTLLLPDAFVRTPQLFSDSAIQIFLLNCHLIVCRIYLHLIFNNISIGHSYQSGSEKQCLVVLTSLCFYCSQFSRQLTELVDIPRDFLPPRPYPLGEFGFESKDRIHGVHADAVALNSQQIGLFNFNYDGNSPSEYSNYNFHQSEFSRR